MYFLKKELDQQENTAADFHDANKPGGLKVLHNTIVELQKGSEYWVAQQSLRLTALQPFKL